MTIMGLALVAVAAAPHTVPQKQPADDVNLLNGTRSYILTADVDELNHTNTSDVNDGVLATDAHYEKEGLPPQPRRFTIDDYDGVNESEVSEDEASNVEDDTTHPRTKRRCCEYDHQEIFVETKTYDGCSSSPHRATNTFSTEQHSCKIFGEGVDSETFSFWFSKD